MPFMALPRAKKGVSCSGVPGLRRAAAGMLQHALPPPSPPPPPALGWAREGVAGEGAGSAPAVDYGARGSGQQKSLLRSGPSGGPRLSVGLAKAAGGQADRQRFLAAGCCSFSLIGTESLFIRASEIGRMQSTLGSAAEASDLVHPGFSSAEPFRKRLFTWGSVHSPRLGGCFVL